MILEGFFQKVISYFSISHVREQKDFLLDSELSHLFLIKGCVTSLQEVEDLLKQGKSEEAKLKGPTSLLYTLWYVTQVVERMEEDRLKDLGTPDADNKGTRLFNLTHTYGISCERFGVRGDTLLHNFCVHSLQVTNELISEVRKQRYSFF